MPPQLPLVFTELKRFTELSRAVHAGKARRIARGIYTFDLKTPVEDLVRRHWLDVLGHEFPGAIISDRSRRRSLPDKKGFLFVVHPRSRPLALPGLTVVPRKGK